MSYIFNLLKLISERIPLAPSTPPIVLTIHPSIIFNIYMIIYFIKLTSKTLSSNYAYPLPSSTFKINFVSPENNVLGLLELLNMILEDPSASRIIHNKINPSIPHNFSHNHYESSHPPSLIRILTTSLPEPSQSL